MLDQAFFHLTHLPKLDKKYILPALAAEYQHPGEETDGVKTSRSVWCYSPFSETKFFNDLQNAIGKPFTAMYYKFPPMSLYNWHTDRDRFCSINFVLNGTDNSMTLFKEETDARLVYNIRVCDYTLHCPTLFNTQIPHAVINNSNKPRFLLTVASETASLEEVKEFLFNYNTEQY